MGLPLGIKPLRPARGAPNAAVITANYGGPLGAEHGSFPSDYPSNGPPFSAAEAGHEVADGRDEPGFVARAEPGPRAQRAGVGDAVDEEAAVQVVGLVLERPGRQAA